MICRNSDDELLEDRCGMNRISSKNLSWKKVFIVGGLLNYRRTTYAGIEPAIAEAIPFRQVNIDTMNIFKTLCFSKINTNLTPSAYISLVKVLFYIFSNSTNT